MARYWQLRELQRKDCINPALNTRVFPDLKLVTTDRDGHIFGDRIACSFTLIKAKVTAGKEKIELPFLLVSDEKAKQITFLGQINRILIDFFN